LQRDELDRYLRHRLNVAGFAGETLFNQAAVAKLHRVTAGTPRLVNIIANKALLLTYGEGGQLVLPRHIRTAAADTPEAHSDWRNWLWAGFAVLMGLELMLSWVMMR
jgi:MSHA biogenesis protein MshM